MNLCRACGVDFGSVAAFDRHRVGVHAYTISEGLRRDPPVDDGRRCLAAWEIEQLTDEAGRAIFRRNPKGKWSIARDLDSVRAAFHGRERGT